jgi:hypothetical protein
VGGGGVVGEAEVKEGAASKVGDEEVAHFEAREEVMTSSKARDEAAGCSGAGIEDGRWRRCSGVWGDRTTRALDGFEKLLSVVRESAGTEILGHGHLMRDAPILRVSTFSSYGRHV